MDGSLPLDDTPTTSTQTTLRSMVPALKLLSSLMQAVLQEGHFLQFFSPEGTLDRIILQVLLILFGVEKRFAKEKERKRI